MRQADCWLWHGTEGLLLLGHLVGDSRVDGTLWVTRRRGQLTTILRHGVLRRHWRSALGTDPLLNVVNVLHYHESDEGKMSKVERQYRDRSHQG